MRTWSTTRAVLQTDILFVVRYDAGVLEWKYCIIGRICRALKPLAGLGK